MKVRVRLGAQFTNTLQVRLLPCETGWEVAVAAQSVDSVTQCDFKQL